MASGIWAQWRDVGVGALAGAMLCVVAMLVIVDVSERDAAEAAAEQATFTETSNLDELAAQFGVTVVWTDDDRNCGLGCYRRDTPNVIYVEPGHSDAKMRHIVLHEVGHALHHRLGLPSSEAGADLFADAMVNQDQ